MEQFHNLWSSSTTRHIRYRAASVVIAVGVFPAAVEPDLSSFAREPLEIAAPSAAPHFFCRAHRVQPLQSQHRAAVSKAKRRSVSAAVEVGGLQVCLPYAGTVRPTYERAGAVANPR